MANPLLRTLIAIVALCGCAALALPAGGLARSQRQPPMRRDRIQVTAPARARINRTYDVTISGYARRHARAYVFIDYGGCASSLSVERQRAAGQSDEYPVKGSFAQTSGWKSKAAGEDHACAYLADPGSGAVLATARQAYRIR